MDDDKVILVCGMKTFNAYFKDDPEVRMNTVICPWWDDDPEHAGDVVIADAEKWNDLVSAGTVYGKIGQGE